MTKEAWFQSMCVCLFVCRGVGGVAEEEAYTFFFFFFLSLTFVRLIHFSGVRGICSSPDWREDLQHSIETFLYPLPPSPTTTDKPIIWKYSASESNIAVPNVKFASMESSEHMLETGMAAWKWCACVFYPSHVVQHQGLLCHTIRCVVSLSLLGAPQRGTRAPPCDHVPSTGRNKYGSVRKISHATTCAFVGF